MHYRGGLLSIGNNIHNLWDICVAVTITTGYVVAN